MKYLLCALMLSGCSITYTSHDTTLNSQDKEIIAACAGHYPVDMKTMTGQRYKMYTDCVHELTPKVYKK